MIEKAKTITLDELSLYALDVKVQKEKERLDNSAKKEQECFKLTKNIIDRLRGTREVIIASRGMVNFDVNCEAYQVSMVITLKDLKEVIDEIPDLASDWTEDKDNNDDDSLALKVWLSETETTDTSEADDSEQNEQ